jgi:outer membrane protein assembly factor BamB
VVQQCVGRLSQVKKLSKYAIAVALIGLTGACQKPPELRHNPVDILPMGSLQRSWFIDAHLDNDPIVRLDVRDKYIYLYTRGKRVIAYDRVAGTPQMNMHVSSPDVQLMPLVELKDFVVFPSATSLEVFGKDGLFQRSIPLSRPLRSHAAGEGTLIFFGSAGPHGGLVEAYDVASPYALQRWEFLTTDFSDVTAGVVAYADTVYSATEGGEVDAVNTERGQIWDTDHGNFKTYGAINADLKADEAGLYIASTDYTLYCVNRGTGKLKWQYFSGTPLMESPVTTVDTVYQYVPGKGLAAVDKLTGAFDRTPRWIHPTATQFLAQDDRYSYLADPHPDPANGAKSVYTIIAVDKQTGKKVFESDHKDFTLVGSNRKDNLIYAGYTNGKIFAIKPVVKAGEIGELVMSEINSNAPVN